MHQGEAFLTTRQEKETEYIGTLLGKAVQQPLAVALFGELGVGKTVLVRGAAKGMETNAQVSSPTFTLMKIYHGKMNIYHFDFYRLEEPDELEELGFEEYIPGDGVAFIEWAQRHPGLLPRERLEIDIERFYDISGEGRRLWFRPFGNSASLVVEKVIETVSWRVNGTLNMIPLTGEETGRLGQNC